MRTTSASASRTAIRSPHAGPSIGSLLADYRSGRSTPQEICARVLTGIVERGDDGVWISVASEADVRARCAALDGFDPNALPLYGIPFGVKDSIDVAGWPTTLACPGYAYLAEQTAPVVQRLLDAGAILIGKNNLDQFATGLNGTRTPYPIPRSVFGQDLISGGSSSGSALAVALGEVPFTVATDTAGSGRVPPALNGVLGFKPSRGLISTVGLVPACRSLDCISLIAGTAGRSGATCSTSSPHPTTATRGAGPRGRTTTDRAPSGSGCRTSPNWSSSATRRWRPPTPTPAAGRRTRSPRSTPPLAPFLQAGELLYSGPVGRRAAGRVRRLPRRASRRRAAGDRHHHQRRRAVRRGRRVPRRSTGWPS